MVTIQSTLADIVKQLPAAVEVMYKYKLGFLGESRVSLKDACVMKGLDTTVILNEILSIDPTKSAKCLHVDLWPTSFLVDFIITNHHSFVRTSLPKMIQQMTKVVRKHGELYAETVAILELLEDLDKAFAEHLEDEEKYLFSIAARQFDHNTIKQVVERNEVEHEAVGKKLQRLRVLTNEFQPPEGACGTHRAVYAGIKMLFEDTVQHQYLENAVLFPRLLAQL